MFGTLGLFGLRNFSRVIGVVATSVLLSAGLNPASAQVQGAGATFPEPIYKKWFAGFQSAQSAQINYQAIGSGGGIKALKNKTVDFAASDAPLSDAEEKEQPIPVVHLPTVGGAVAIVYNLPGVGSGLHFTGDILAGIYLGTITKWNDPALVAANPGRTLPDLKITPVSRADGSGTTYIFTNYLKKTNAEWAGKIGAGKSVNITVGLKGEKNPGVATQITKIAGSLGYVELAFAVSQKLPYGAVKNKAGNFVAPSVASTSAAIRQYAAELAKNIKTPTVDAPGLNSYPICSLTYILIPKATTANVAMTTKLWAWTMQPAQQDAAKELLYAPLPAALVAQNLAVLKTITGAQVQ